MAKIIGNSELLDTWSSIGLAVKPDDAKLEIGWELSEKPPHEFMNWLQKNFGEKINHILKNGISLWNAETNYEPGNLVNHNLGIWACINSHTNDEPDPTSTNWTLFPKVFSSEATPETAVLRNPSGTAKFSDPVDLENPITKNFYDERKVFVENNPPTEDDLGESGRQWFVAQNNGNEIWSVLNHDVGSIFSLATDGKNVFSAGIDSRLIASNFETGSVSWNTPGANLNPMVYSDGIIYGGDNSVTNVKTYNAETGALIWNEALASDGSGISQFLVTEDKIFCITNNRRLFSLEKTDGSTNWFVDLAAGSSFTNLILADGVLYITNSGGGILRRNASDGSSAGSSFSTGSVSSITGSTYENGLFFIFQNASNQFSILSKTGSILETKTIPTGLYANGRVSNGFFLLNSITIDGFSILSKTGVHLAFYDSVNAIPLLYYQGSVFSVTGSILKRFQGLPKHYVSDGNSWKSVSIMEGV